MIGHDGNSAGLWFLRGAQLFSAVEGTINTFILLLGVSRMRNSHFIRIFSCLFLVWWEWVEQFCEI